MEPPSSISDNQGKMCKLKKDLHGLKQASRSGFEKFITTILALDFCSNDHESSMFVKTTSHDRILFLLYIYDMIIICDDVDWIDELKL